MKRMHRKKLSLAVAQAVGAGIFVTAPLAYGQAQPAQPATPGFQEKITITGSRIPSPNLESTSPIATINSQQIKMEGPISTENLINSLPQASAEQGSTISNGSTGTATANLRGLGSVRTLVLIDGRRLPPGSPLQGGYAPDLNEIPTQMIQRVEVYTGGASAVYGSDAVAGVVNFIMNRNFEGVQGDISHSFYNHQQHSAIASLVDKASQTNPAQYHVPGDVNSDGEVDDYSVIIGGNFAGGKGNATLFMGYKNIHPLLQANRDYSACSLNSNSSGHVCAGSSTSFPGRFIDNNTGSSFTIADSAGNVRPFASSDLFNFGPYNYYQRPDQRYNVMANAHYDVVPWARVYGDFSFHDSHTLAQIAPSGAFGIEFFPADTNPLLSPSFKNAFGITPTTPGDIILLRRNIEGGGRVDDLRHTSYRGVVGVKGELPFATGWDYDVFYQLGKVILSEEYHNDLSVTRINRALNVVSVNGVPTCQSVVDGTDPNCVPWNIFQLGGVNQAALNYLQTPGFERGSTEQSVWGFNVGADLGMYNWRLPWAKDGIGLSFGAERRTEKLNFDTDLEFSTFDLAGQGGPVIGRNGQVQNSDYFAEVRVPIIQDRPGAQLLSVNGSYRYSDYSTGKQTNTWGVGAEWAPIKEARLRASYQKAVRAANIIELFLAQGFNLFSFASDPCGTQAGGGPPTATLAQCLQTGLPANLYGSQVLTNPAGQGNFLQGGNPNLDPESGKTYTFGVVLTPVRNFNASVDYFNIKVDNVIQPGIQPALVLTQCLNAGQFCDLIHRDAKGTLWLPGGGFITATNLNLAKLKTSGVDITANYTQPLGAWGSLNLDFKGTYVHEFVTQPIPGGGDYDCAGFFGPTCLVPAPKWGHSLMGIWTTPWNLDLSATWRHKDSVDLDATSSNPLLAAPFNQADAKMGARDYLDLAASWYMTKQLTLYVGVNNVTDRDPPIVGAAGLAQAYGNGNTYPQVYDAFGRQIFIHLSAKF